MKHSTAQSRPKTGPASQGRLARFRAVLGGGTNLRVAVLALACGMSAIACKNRVDWIPPPVENNEEDANGTGASGPDDDSSLGGAESMESMESTDSTSMGGAASQQEDDGEALHIPNTLIWPDDCEARWQYKCESYDPLEQCRCNTSIPAEIEQCGGYGALYCDHFFGGSYDVWVECECRHDAPGTAEDCSSPEDFSCEHDDGEGPPEQCTCSP